jgi:hydrogenase maturation factor HypF (carbamoyltransferase family)
MMGIVEGILESKEFELNESGAITEVEMCTKDECTMFEKTDIVNATKQKFEELLKSLKESSKLDEKMRVNKDVLIKELDNLDEDRQINRFLNICNEAKFFNVAIGANLSYSYGINFIVKTEVGVKKAIVFQEFDLQVMLRQMKQDDVRKKLLNNFTSKYQSRIDALEKNKYNLFEILCVILDISKPSFESLSNKALEFRGNGGLKVDIDFYNNEVKYSSLIGSVMSFILAGADAHYIAYSIFEAFGDMTINTLNQLKKTFKINNIVMMGDMFENSVLYSRILSKYQLANPFFSKKFALDD